MSSPAVGSASNAPTRRPAAFKTVKPTLVPTFMDRWESKIGVGLINGLDKLPVKYVFNLDKPPKVPAPRITVGSPEYQDLKAHLKPGDVILCGVGDSFVHAIVYIGNGEIVHALAQEPTDRKRTLWDKAVDGAANLAEDLPGSKAFRDGLAAHIRALPRSTDDGIGVVHETLDSYFGRATRDNVVVMRDPSLTSADVQAMKTFALAQVGKPYDYGFSSFDQSHFYCTELAVDALAQTAHPPRIQGHYQQIGVFKREVFRNDEIVQSPDLEPVWKSQSYDRSLFGQKHPVTIQN